MAYTTLYDGIIFIEGEDAEATKLGEVKCDLSFKFGAQLKNLNDVKRVLADAAKKQGANCVLNFTYGQKARWLALDDVAFKGAGVAATLSPQRHAQLVEKCQSR